MPSMFGNCYLLNRRLGFRRWTGARLARGFVHRVKRGEQRIGIDGLCHMVVHARLQTALALLHERMRSHGEDREIVESRVGAEHAASP